MSSLTSLDDPGQITWFDSCDLSHSEMEEFKGKETTVLNKWLVWQGLQKIHGCVTESII